MKEGNLEQFNNHEWGIHEGKEKRIEVVGELDEALKTKDVLAAQKVMQDPRTLETLIKDRGENDENFERLEDSWKMLFQEKFGSEANFFNTDPKEIINFVHEYKLPEQVLVNLADAAFHKRDKIFLARMATVTLKNRDMFQDQVIPERIMHGLATYEIVDDGDKHASLQANMNLKKISKDPILREKADFGTKVAKNLKPKELAKDFHSIAKNLKELDYEPDAFRAQIEEAKARIELSGRQKKGGHIKDSRDNLVQAKELAEGALEYAENSDYENLRNKSLEVIAEIKKVMGEK